MLAINEHIADPAFLPRERRDASTVTVEEDNNADVEGKKNNKNIEHAACQQGTTCDPVRE